MIPTPDVFVREHRLRVARLERSCARLAKLDWQGGRHDRTFAIRALWRRLGAALIAVGARLQGAAPARRPVAAGAERLAATAGACGRAEDRPATRR
jgi:hypothetical protein